MTIAYTESEAQARFPEALNRVREGETVVITCEGEPVAELRPIKRKTDGEETAPENQTMEERIAEMRRRGTLSPKRPNQSRSSLKPVARVPGGLQRFLEGRSR